MDIADKIIAGNQADKESFDEFGLPLSAEDTIDYLVVRVLLRNPDLYLDPEDGKLYIKSREVPMTQPKLVEMADHFNSWCKGGKWPLVYNRIKRFAPRLDRSKLQISEHLLWDYDEHKIIRKK